MNKLLSVNKTFLLVLVILVSLAIVLTGIFAWTNFSQRARNMMRGYTQPGVNLHDDFWNPNKDVYVENSGEKTVYVRINFKEFMRIGKDSIYPGSSFDDENSWELHSDSRDINNPCPVDNCGLNFHNYYTWVMGNTTSDSDFGWKWYIPAPPELRTQVATDGSIINDSSKTVYGIDYTTDAAGKKVVIPQVSEKGKTYAQISTEMAADAGYNSLLTVYTNATAEKKEDARAKLESYSFITWGVKMTQYTVSVLTMKDWLQAGSKSGKFWVMDIDGWFYWAEGLPSEMATGLLLSQVINTAKPSDDWFYGIDVYLNAVTEDDFNTLGAGGLTENALRLLYISTGAYKDSGFKEGTKTIWYKSLGQNVYQQGIISVDANGVSSWARHGDFVAGVTGDAPFTPANFIKTASDGWVSSAINTKFDFASTTDLSVDAMGGMLKFHAGGAETIQGIEKGYDGLYYFKIAENTFVRALSVDESMKIDGAVVYGKGMLGIGAHKVFWVPEGAKLGDRTNVSENPWYTTNVSDGNGSNVVYYHQGNGVYYKSASNTSTTAAEPSYINGLGVTVNTPKPYISLTNRTNLASDTASPSSLMLYVGNYYTKTPTGQYTSSTKTAYDTSLPVSETFKVIDVVKSPLNGMYYIQVDEKRQNMDGSPIYSYYAVGNDERLGGVDDIKVWAGSEGIGSADDSAVPPPIIPKSVTIGSTFNFGTFWQDSTNAALPPTEPIAWTVKAIKGSKVLLVANKILYGDYFDGGNYYTWSESRPRIYLNTTFTDKAFAGTGFMGGFAKDQIVLTAVNTGVLNSIANPGNNYFTSTPSDTGYKANGGYTLDYVFILSKDELSTYFPSDASRIVQSTAYARTVHANVINYHVRNRFNTSGRINYIYGESGGFYNHPTNTIGGYRPALWVEFDPAKWGTYGNISAGGNWTNGNSNPFGKSYWMPD